MKKVLVIGLLFVAGVAGASCMGPYCWDDQGAYMAGTIQDGNGSGLPNLTAAQVLAAKPRALGQEVWCTNCGAFNGGAGMVCVSTETTTSSNAYIAESSGTAVTACK
jgi:hypothetical protein